MDGVWAIIPARLGSTRFPEKVLAAETGRPLIAHVCERAAEAVGSAMVRVATDAERVADAVRLAGFEAVMTRADHENGTSRLVEAVATLGLSDDAVVVNVQGDEPEIEAEAILAAAGAMGTANIGDRDGVIGTIASPFREGENPTSPNAVKVAMGAAVGEIDGCTVHQAMYFSRAEIPFHREGGEPAGRLRHVGVYAYTVAGLRRYASLPATPLERSELLEQLRWLEHGLGMRVAVLECRGVGVDTLEDYRAFVGRWRSAEASR